LIIGGGIFLGKAIANRLSKIHDVFVLNRGNNPIPKNCTWLKADRNVIHEFAKAISKKIFDVVIDTCCNNSEQMRISLDILKDKFNQYIYISTASVYKNIKNFPIKETEETGGTKIAGSYGVKKFEAEQMLCNSKVNYIIFRPFYLFGENNNFDRESYIFLRLLNYKHIILPAMGKPIIQFGSVNDLSMAIEKLLLNPISIRKTYNFGNDIYVSFKQFVDMCSRIAGIKALIYGIEANQIGISSVKWFPFYDENFFGDISLLKKDLNIKHFSNLEYDLSETFKKTKDKLLKLEFKQNDTEIRLLTKHKNLLVKL
jgi:dTDP-glucose 4,6-dehydratase